MFVNHAVACTTDETKLWLSPSAKQHQNSCSGFPPVYQDFSTRHDWPVKKAITDLPISMKGNLKHTSGNLLSPLGAQNKDLKAPLQTIPAEVKLSLRRRLTMQWRQRNIPKSGLQEQSCCFISAY